MMPNGDSKDWLQKLDETLDEVRNTTTRIEGVVTHIDTRTATNETQLNSHELRLNTLEMDITELKAQVKAFREVPAQVNKIANTISEMRGSMKALMILGGIIVGLAAIGQTIVMLIK